MSSNRDWLIEGELHAEGNCLTSGENNRERLNTGIVNATRLGRPIYDSSLSKIFYTMQNLPQKPYSSWSTLMFLADARAARPRMNRVFMMMIELKFN